MTRAFVHWFCIFRTSKLISELLWIEVFCMVFWKRATKTKLEGSIIWFVPVPHVYSDLSDSFVTSEKCLTIVVARTQTEGSKVPKQEHTLNKESDKQNLSASWACLGFYLSFDFSRQAVAARSVSHVRPLQIKTTDRNCAVYTQFFFTNLYWISMVVRLPFRHAWNTYNLRARRKPKVRNNRSILREWWQWEARNHHSQERKWKKNPDNFSSENEFFHLKLKILVSIDVDNNFRCVVDSWVGKRLGRSFR